MPVTVTWTDVLREAERLLDRHGEALSRYDGVYGIARGGCPIAAWIGAQSGLGVLDEPAAGCLIVDDLVDTGRTAKRVLAAVLVGREDTAPVFDALWRKPWSPDDLAPHAAVSDDWLVFPWEANESGPEDAVVRLLEHIGDDPTRDGLHDTPARVVRSLSEMTSGYRMDPAAILSTRFDVEYSQMVVVRGIEFTSLCEHHMLPFTGTVDVGYLPKHHVVGLSKIPRLVEAFALRLQIQERMTQQIADALAEHLDPEGVAVVVRAVHSCMSCRGVRKQAEMITSAMLGVLMHGPAARAEFLGFVD